MQKSLILIGMKSSGKTTIGRELAQRLGVAFIDVDHRLEAHYLQTTGKRRTFRQILAHHGGDYFRTLEQTVLRTLAEELQAHTGVFSTGGGTVLDPENRAILAAMGRVIFLDVAAEILLPRIIAGGIPAFFPYPDDPARSLRELLAARRPIYCAMADLVIAYGNESPELVAERIVGELCR
ncbi:MAG: shikimate kinase [Candidatus Viridilinea halotolerans]|uniref:Shikimate kinase n=1 Tax=Candidatus Viridilinea halotolerans TaxID=2491704 RepID=A0A426TZA9_9CHLR|nr:MAG: shikimate kinase [Candidatus Viridilinea halotolerans]